MSPKPPARSRSIFLPFQSWDSSNGRYSCIGSISPSPQRFMSWAQSRLSATYRPALMNSPGFVSMVTGRVTICTAAGLGHSAIRSSKNVITNLTWAAVRLFRVGMAKLTTASRNAIPTSKFALPGRRYPIEDAAHARNALARVSQHGSPAEKTTVRRKVRRLFSGIKQRG